MNTTAHPNGTKESPFRFERPMDPSPALARLDELREVFDGQVDINNHGGPNEAMKATMIADDVHAMIERAAHGLRTILEAARNVGSNPAEAHKLIEQTARHALAALGERP